MIEDGTVGKVVNHEDVTDFKRNTKSYSKYVKLSTFVSIESIYGHLPGVRRQWASFKVQLGQQGDRKYILKKKLISHSKFELVNTKTQKQFSDC